MGPFMGLLIVVCALTLVGCQTTRAVIETTPEQDAAFLLDFPTTLHSDFLPALTEGPQNEVMHYMNAGLKAFSQEEWSAAEIAFDRALLKIETFFADNEAAKQARSNFTPESYKDFLGEPYERMMAYYYRGLLYLRVGDFENARASFRGGLLQDSLAMQEEYQQDSALLAYLIGWASYCNGDSVSAQDAFDEALEYKPGLPLPKDTDDTLLIAETGLGPYKEARGQFKEFLVIAEGDTFAEHRAVFAGSEETVTTYPAENIYTQATTRGGRAIDAILAGKAQFKADTAKTGQALMAAGMAMQYSGNNDAAALGGVLALAGMIAAGVAEAANPEADTRMWINLPEQVHILPVSSQMFDQSTPIKVSFKNKDNKELSSLSQQTRLNGPEACKFAWTTSRPKTYEDVHAPLF